jgi:hypothetical protein
MEPRRICRGCVMMKIDRYVCLFRASMLEDECPCIECLVKVICEESCDTRREIYSALILKHELKDPYNFWTKGDTICKKT